MPSFVYIDQKKEEQTRIKIDDIENTRIRVLKMRALYTFEPQEDWGLPLQKGDVIEVTEQLRDESTRGWWRGQVGELEGLFPLNYAEVIEIQEPKKLRVNQDVVSRGILWQQKKLFPDAFVIVPSSDNDQKGKNDKSPPQNGHPTVASKTNRESSLILETERSSIKIKDVNRLVRTLSHLSTDRSAEESSALELERLHKEIRQLKQQLEQKNLTIEQAQEMVQQSKQEGVQLKFENNTLVKEKEKLLEELSSAPPQKEDEGKPHLKLEEELKVARKKISKYKTKTKHRDIKIQKLEKELEQANIFKQRYEEQARKITELELTIKQLSSDSLLHEKESISLRSQLQEIQNEISLPELTTNKSRFHRDDHNNQNAIPLRVAEIPPQSSVVISPDAPQPPPFEPTLTPRSPIKPPAESPVIPRLRQITSRFEEQKQSPKLPPRPSQIALPNTRPKDHLVGLTSKAKVSFFESKIRELSAQTQQPQMFKKQPKPSERILSMSKEKVSN